MENTRHQKLTPVGRSRSRKNCCSARRLTESLTVASKFRHCLGNIDAQRVFGYGIFKHGKRIQLPYPLEKFHADVVRRSFHNGRFIRRIREKAASLPNVKLEQGTVISLIEENGIVKGFNIRLKMIDVPSHFVGLVLENCQLPFPNHGHKSVVWLMYQVRSFPLLLMVKIAKYLKTIVPPELHDAFVAAVDKGNIRTMPNRSMLATPQPTPGALLMGDAFNICHPLTGRGMTVALSDIVLLRYLLRPLKDLNYAVSLCKYLESFYTLHKAPSTRFFFFASPNEAHEEMRKACFDYRSLGGEFSNGPISLLSSPNPLPLSLVFHFFSVGVCGVVCLHLELRILESSVYTRQTSTLWKF
ncbi:hypothetical protein Cgig2_029904 [Carnegiea gigantea]|uniref:Squalene monooxygenase n=1 Tax=Carnegiea gigantea TaxID=171969 RepID=A0A9Q1KJR8_9CARY|nr:hypothetical protein Cgig2_029904 [Carnegiea gigantea]